MNNKLKKDTKQAEYYKKYHKNHRVVCINLDKQFDKDIIGWLDKQDNISEAIRKVLREEVTK